MARWQPQRGWRRWLYTWPAIVAVVLIGLLLGRSVWQGFWRERLVVADRQRLEQELRALKEREGKLRGEIELLKTDRGLEGKIREKFPVIKAGERVITLVATDTAAATVTASSSRWQSWWSRQSP